MTWMKTVWVARLLVVATMVGTASAANYYAAPSGSGSTCSNSAPCTFNTAFGKAGGGDTIYLKGPRYREIIGFDPDSPWNYPDPQSAKVIPRGESWDHPVRIKVAPGEHVVTRDWFFHRGRYIEVDGEGRLTLDGESDPERYGILIGHDHIRLKNLEIKNFGRIAILGGCEHCEFINLHVHHNGSHGLYTQGPTLVEGGNYHHQGGGRVEYGGYGLHFYPDPKDIVVRNVRSCDNKQGGMFSRYNIEVTNSVFCNNGGNGIWHNHGGKFLNNTIVGNQDAGLRCDGDNTVRNNIVYGNRGTAITCGGGQSNNVMSDPRFMNASEGNYRLQESSPARNAGMSLSEVRCDMDGNGRPAGGAYDAGAYEYGGRPSEDCFKGVTTPPARPKPNKRVTRGNKPER